MTSRAPSVPKPFPKPPKRVKEKRKILFRKKALPKARKKILGKYLNPKYLKLRRQVVRRAKGMCEEPGCTLPGEQVHHAKGYGKGRGVKSLLVPIGDLQLLCFWHHQSKHDHRISR